MGEGEIIFSSVPKAERYVTGTTTGLTMRTAFSRGRGRTSCAITCDISFPELITIGPRHLHIPRLKAFFEGGAVGIGTRSPDVKLSVNGTARTKEVIVEAENWPDYVFDEGYDLRSPTRLAAFIEREGHLPALPPAEKVEAEGQTVGEVQRGLVQTVEELARYAIEQRRRVDSLRRANTRLH